ncbi:hypothetical protein GW17_00000386 [Ensete ventricosum]|uniref:Uncharacterized protein n=1 Tax=Ensete ventricosum TaxID=4639 RepID=A0A426Z0N7_ENSVE|nr:hypothetical protein B296_00043875 [Ensete ventricosum]RWW34845.1 hypothetical protein GW17_00000386 [Ensete ventricosum]RZR80523.1 hypothetical protein BHM03_00006572 [Ensete ventricosum]
MEALQKLERVQSMLSFMEARGLSSSHRDADRFLADFILFLVGVFAFPFFLPLIWVVVSDREPVSLFSSRIVRENVF